MFGIGAGEFVVIAVLLLIAVGPARLPGLMRAFGKTLRQVKRMTHEFREASGIDELLAEADPNRPLPPVRPPEPPVPAQLRPHQVEPQPVEGPTVPVTVPSVPRPGAPGAPGTRIPSVAPRPPHRARGHAGAVAPSEIPDDATTEIHMSDGDDLTREIPMQTQRHSKPPGGAAT